MDVPTVIAPDEHFGRKLGKYEVVCRLATSGTADIFLAFQQGSHGFRKCVVLKQLRKEACDDEDFVRMFVQEAKITSRFSHQNIAHVFDFDEADGEAFLVMEFVPGASLVELARACIASKEWIPTGLALMVGRDVALALHHAHTFADPGGRPLPVLHRDVSEKNVMIAFDGTVKLLDFGIAKPLDRPGRTQIGVVKGTAGYMSPEQIRGEKLDPRSDVFSLGVVIHELLAGQRLFHRKDHEEEMLAPLTQEVVGPSRRNPEVSAELDAVVLRALARNRQERFSTAQELALALESAAGMRFWGREQAAGWVQRLFAARREQTRSLLSAVSPATDESSEPLPLGSPSPEPPTRLDRLRAVPPMSFEPGARSAGGEQSGAVREGQRQTSPGVQALDSATPLPPSQVITQEMAELGPPVSETLREEDGSDIEKGRADSQTLPVHWEEREPALGSGAAKLGEQRGPAPLGALTPQQGTRPQVIIYRTSRPPDLVAWLAAHALTPFGMGAIGLLVGILLASLVYWALA